MKLRYPPALDIDHSDELCRLYRKAFQAKEGTVIFDLSQTENIYPFGIILVTCTIQECLVRNKKCIYYPPSLKATKRFLASIGFNDFFAIPKEEGLESEQNVQLMHKNLQLRRRSKLDPVLINHLVEVFKHNLNLSLGIRGSLKLSLNETMTNAIDHSESESGYYICAQSYPNEKLLIVCIADRGIGILRSLKQVPQYSRLRSDCNAIVKSVEEGVTSREHAAGLGLNHILKFVRVNEGKVYIVSGEGKVLWDYSEGREHVKKSKNKQSFQGTIINIVINIDKEGRYFLIDEESPIFD